MLRIRSVALSHRFAWNYDKSTKSLPHCALLACVINKI